jgi:hypothetical protein
MKRFESLLLAVCCAGLLSACSSESSSYMIDGGDTALTLLRDKPYLWSGSWEMALVVTHLPECQRRHKLKSAGDGNFKLEVYRPPEGGYILHHGKRWYVAELRGCQLQMYAEPPSEPGELIGAFEARDEPVRFVADAATAATKPPSNAGGGNGVAR